MPTAELAKSRYPIWKNWRRFTRPATVLAPPGFSPASRTRRLRRLRSFVDSERAVILDYGCGDGRVRSRKRPSGPAGGVFWGFEMAAHQQHVAPDGRVTIIRGSIADLLAHLPPQTSSP